MFAVFLFPRIAWSADCFQNILFLVQVFCNYTLKKNTSLSITPAVAEAEAKEAEYEAQEANPICLFKSYTRSSVQ